MTVFEPIEERFLLPDYLCAVRFQDGFYFARVLDRSSLTYKPYDQLGFLQPGGNSMTFPVANFTNNAISPNNQNQTNVVLASNLSNAAQRDALYIPQPGPSLLHGAIGVSPSYVRVYIHYPNGERIMGRWPGYNPPSPANGDPVSYFNGIQSPFDSPTTYRELVLPPQVHLSFEFFLESQYQIVQPLLNLRFSWYYLQILNPVGDPYEKTLIGQIARRQLPASFLTAGGAESPLASDYAPVGTFVPEGVNPIALSDAVKL